MKNIELLNEYLNKDFSKEKKKNNSIALIGLGPHAKRIYLNYFKKHKVNLSLVVDLESKRDDCKKYLLENGFKNTKLFTIEDKLKDCDKLPQQLQDNLLAVCKTMEITHIIISTEPKAHNMYLQFALNNNIHVLTDKPITVTKNMTSLKSINKVRKQYYDILKLASNSNAMCKVLCQRQYHKGYEYVKSVLSEVVNKYQVPITYIEINHCDGNWEMPHDLQKENHPYKYGYGKLFHSGYHFIDLLSDFIKINNRLTGSKKITKGEIYSNCFTPNDEINIFNIDDYNRIFKNQNIPLYYNQNKNPKFNKYGEKNFYGLLKFTNSYNQTITNANLNLLHYGFSRRGWIESKDFYKKNGRIRHEHINIQVGTLLNIQIHSYQSKEIKDRTNLALEEQVGGLEHFDIDIYRNVDIIGGKPFERISLGDLYKEKDKISMLGYNEFSREEYLNNFLKGKCDRGDIRDQALAIEILYSCSKGIYNYYKNKDKKERIIVRNSYTYPIKIANLKKYSNKSNINEEKTIEYFNKMTKGEYEIGVVSNYLKNKGIYDAYIYVSDEESIASSLLYKEIKSKFSLYLYLGYLNYIVKYKKINKIIKVVEK